MMWLPVTLSGSTVAVDPVDAVTMTGDGDTRPATPEEVAAAEVVATELAARAEAAATLAAHRAALVGALALIELYPAPTPEETLLIEQEVAAALLGFRQMSDPPADVVALAAALVSWRAEV